MRQQFVGRGCHGLSDSTALALHPLRKILDANHRALVHATRDQLVLVPGLNLESHFLSFRMDNSNGAGDALAKGSRGQMTQIDFSADRAFSRFKERRYCLPGGALEQAD